MWLGFQAQPSSSVLFFFFKVNIYFINQLVLFRLESKKVNEQTVFIHRHMWWSEDNLGKLVSAFHRVIPED